MRHRAGAIIVRDDSILLIYRNNSRGEYYVTPGGGVDEGERPAEALVRELREEAGATVEVKECLLEFAHERVDQYMYFFRTELLSAPETISWQETFKEQEGDQYRFEWVPLSSVQNLCLQPEEIKHWITAELVPKKD